MKSTKILVLTVSALLLFSCAKDRPLDDDATRGAELSAVEKRVAKASFNQKDTLWYSKATIIKRSDTTPKKWMFVGSAGPLQVGYFKFSKEKLSFLDAVSTNDKDGKITSDNLLYAWDIDHSEYSKKETNAEVTNVQMEDPNLAWDDKNFFKVNFAEGAISPRNDIGAASSVCWEQKSAALLEDTLQIGSEHIAFNVEYIYEYSYDFNFYCNSFSDLFDSSPTYTVQIRYSFKPRRENNYEPYVYSGENDPLMKKYGYFKTRVLSKDEDGVLDITWLMNRWDPKKIHTYYFAKDVPEELKIYYTHPQNGVFAKLNEVLEDTGEPIRFNIKENDGTCVFGDVGCSFVKINTEPHNRAPLGYGPSDADPLTGEIISGRTMIWSSSMKRSIKLYMSAKEEYKQVAPETSTVYKLMAKTLNQPVSEWTSTAIPLKDFDGTLNSEETNERNVKIADAYHFLLPQYTYTRRHYNLTTWWADGAAEDRTHVHELEEMKSFLSNMRDEAFLSPDTLKGVEADMDAELEMAHMMHADDKYESGFKRIGQYTGCEGLIDSMATPIRAMVINNKDVDEIFETMFYMVAIHELGHTLNLEHNFYGSADVRNFDAPAPAFKVNGDPMYKRDSEGNVVLENDKPVQLLSNMSTTSVMEYLDQGEEYDEVHDWGPYDKAAITYAYTSGSKDLSKVNDQDFLFCTHDSSNYMAMCNTWDTGSTPSEIAFALINGYESRYPYLNYRYDRAIWHPYYKWGRAWTIMWKLKTFMKMQKATYQLGDMQRKLVLKNYNSDEVKDVHNAVQTDMKQAVKLSLAFYDAMIHQKDSDRNFKDSINEEYGTLEKLGIWPEKLFATIMLYNNHYMSYNPNEGWLLTSYLDYLDDADVKDVYSNVLERGLTERIDEYADVDIARHAMFMFSTIDSGATAGSGVIGNSDFAGVQCFRPGTFADEFGSSLRYEDAQILELDAENLSDYYQREVGQDGKVHIAALRSNNKVFVASQEQNPVMFKVIKEAADIGSDSKYKIIYIRRGARKLRSATSMYNIAMGEQAQYCQ